MALPQSKLREIIFQLLYSHDTGRNEELGSIALLMRELQVSRSNVLQALAKASLVREQLSTIDAAIAKTAHGYAFERIQLVEKNILRLAIYELLFDKSIPPKVAISEAMRLARKFSTPESANFVNAILDSIYKESEGQTPEYKAIEESVREIEVQEQLIKQNQQRHES